MADDKHILLVDDDKDMLMLIERWLKKEYRVTTAISGKAAIVCIENDRPDLVLLDYAMPELDGPGTLKEIRNNPAWREIKVAFLTGMDSVENENEISRLNPVEFLSKGMGKKRLLSEIEKLMKDI